MSTLPPETVRRIEDTAAGNLNPTNDQVRQHLGDGSLSHISPVMRAFRARQGEQRAEQAPALQPPANSWRRSWRSHGKTGALCRPSCWLLRAMAGK